jgi:hypothetical protein
MTRAVVGILAAAIAVGQDSCQTDVRISFPFPLDAPDAASIDERLVGRWDCREPDADETFVLTMLDFDGRQYYMSTPAEDVDAVWRAYATTLQGTAVLNFALLGEQDDWHYARYSFPGVGRLEIRMVLMAPFDAVHDSQEEVRRLLARNLENNEFYDAAIACVRRSGEDEEAAEQADAPDKTQRD